MKKSKNDLINCIIVAFVFTFNICVFAPLEFYYSNVFDLWFTVDYILPSIILVSVILFLITFCAMYFSKEKVSNGLLKFLFILMVCLYLQGNYLNVGYGVLNGTEIDWSSMILKGVINTLVWIAIIVVLIIVLKKINNFKKITNIASLFILGIQVITLTVIILMSYIYSADTNISFNAPFYLDATNMFDMSKDENIVVFVSDTFEATYMNNIIEKYPEFKEKLKDFIYFDNTTGTSLMTYSAMPTILTGETCQVGQNLKENVKYCFDNTNFYDILLANGYDVELYTDVNLIPSDEDRITNKVDKKLLIDNSSKVKLTKLLYECVGYKYLPHFLKSNFVVDTIEFNRVSATDVKQYVFDDVAYNKELVENGIKTESNNKKYKLYHLDGAHTPYTVTKDIEYDLSKEYYELDASERQENQVYAALKILVNYVEKLKESGTYDNTTILLFADHGWENRYHINLLVKPKENNAEFSVSHTPISIVEDFIPTVLNIATNSKDYGKDFFDYSENDIRKRNIYNYTFTRGDNTYNVLSKVTMTTESFANEMNSYYVSEQEYVNLNEVPAKEYKFDKEINILKNKNMDYVVLEGILEQDIRSISKGTNIGSNAKIKVKTCNTDSDIKASIKIGKVYFDFQDIIISVGEKELLKESLNISDGGKVLEFEIPKDIWSKNEVLEINFKFPNGKLGNPSALGEETLLMSMIIESIIFNK